MWDLIVSVPDHCLSATTVLLYGEASVMSLTEYFKSKKRKLFCCLVDFTKAFDNIWSFGLWQKFLKHGIEGKIFNIIRICITE